MSEENPCQKLVNLRDSQTLLTCKEIEILILVANISKEFSLKRPFFPGDFVVSNSLQNYYEKSSRGHDFVRNCCQRG